MKPRCPDCDSDWIGYPIPNGAVVVRDDNGKATIAHPHTGRFVEIDDLDQTQGLCLDCRALILRQR